MSARATVSYTPWYERQRLTSGPGTSPPPRRSTRPGRVLHPGSRRVPRRRPPVRPAVGRRIPAGGWARSERPPGTGPATQVDDYPGEDRPTMVGRQADGARVRDRPVDWAAPGEADPPGVRHPTPPVVSQHLAPRPGLHPAETPPRPSPA